jgi:hypothetical protein
MMKCKNGTRLLHDVVMLLQRYQKVTTIDVSMLK